MADKEKDQDKKKAQGGGKEKAEKKPEKAPKAEKPPKGDKAEAAPAEGADDAGKKAKAAPPRPPADPRAKVWKKFQGRFLPRGPLRDRYHALETRWNSGEDHGGVTVDELKSLLTDWRASRQKRQKVQA